MELSNDLISQFVKITNSNAQPEKETVVYGTIKDYEGSKYVQLDGSDLLTPISTTTEVVDGERVMVTIKNHTATVTGNLSSPSARDKTVKELGTELGNKISEFEIIIADKVSVDQLEAEAARIEALVAEKVSVDQLEAVEGTIETLNAEVVAVSTKLTADEAEIERLKTTKLDAEIADIKYATVEGLNATNIKVNNLEATYGEFASLTTDKFKAYDATISDLEANTLSVEEADLRYANIDFSNIGSAAMETFYAKSGLIEDVVVGDGTITGNLVGVTIKGDLIEGGTVVADKLIILGEDGLYYKLNYDGVSIESEQTDYNSLNGSVITAKSITATKISVDDLVAFDATIGGFNITDRSLYSGVKESINNTTVGIYLDNEGQVAFGDETNFLKFYKDTDDTYKLEISAQSIMLSQSAKNVEAALEETDKKITSTQTTLTETINSNYDDYNKFVSKFSKYIRFMEDENGNPNDTALTIGSGDSALTLELDNESGITFKKKGIPFGWWDGDDFYTGNIVIQVTERAQFGNFAYVPRTDGSLSFLKVESRTGFYAVIKGTLMVMYGSYPILENTTMIISDIPAVLDGTKLILGEY